MIQVTRANDRGYGNHGWLETWHSFSFGDYYDPTRRGFRSLRVINEDFVAPGAGFPTHPHRDMEILTYVIDGALAHRDSLGSENVVKPGEIQYMSAGSGIEHSEYNAAPGRTHLLQIWIQPGERNLTPHYGQNPLPPREANSLTLIAGPDENAPAPIRQDAWLYRGLLDSGREITWELSPARHGWIQIVRGNLRIDDLMLHAGDGAAISGEAGLTLRADSDVEFLAFDLN